MSETTAKLPWKPAADGGLLLTVRATPKGGRDAIDGIDQLADGSCVLKVRVRASPIEGEANDAVSRTIAKAAGIPPTSVSLVRGASARIKVFRLAGQPGALAAAIQNTLGAGTGKIR